ncbi:hypothetical protein ACFFX1_43240 [Dactylosporangium sucinum]|uniref:BioF2-like acetyltransferase domain-containing protein n=1 Tax=Dactylosporangium sucinum TaxID=1424081 RepID=A0A917X038_9ACTN|nr:hypothetical protein [Dactylosporangium sucinum]GGM45358.1 hypothetical protein GCM10007977_053650 [Dactylosporangium sucinum]
MSGDLEFEPFDPSADPAPAAWADAVHDLGLHQAWAWPLVRTAPGRCFAGILRDGDKAVGVATARVRGVLADVECFGTSSFTGLGLAGGLPAALRPDAVDPALFPAAVAAFESALRREFGRRLPFVAYRQVWSDGLPAVLRGATVVREGAPVAVLHNRFADHEAYLRSLTKSRRVDQRRLARRIDADPGLSAWVGPAAGAAIDVEALYRLCRDTARRNHRTLWPPLRYWSSEKFAAVLSLPDVEVIRYTDADGGLVAAGVVFDHPVAPVLGPWGARPPGPDRRSGLWFDHLDRLIRRTIAAGRPFVVAGKGQAGPKESLGFAPHPQWSVVRRLLR